MTETETDKNGFYRIVFRCSYRTETLMPLSTVAILSVSASVSVLVSVSVSALLHCPTLTPRQIRYREINSTVWRRSHNSIQSIFIGLRIRQWKHTLMPLLQCANRFVSTHYMQETTEIVGRPFIVPFNVNARHRILIRI